MAEAAFLADFHKVVSGSEQHHAFEITCATSQVVSWALHPGLMVDSEEPFISHLVSERTDTCNFDLAHVPGQQEALRCCDT